MMFLPASYITCKYIYMIPHNPNNQKRGLSICFATKCWVAERTPTHAGDGEHRPPLWLWLWACHADIWAGAKLKVSPWMHDSGTVEMTPRQWGECTGLASWHLPPSLSFSLRNVRPTEALLTIWKLEPGALSLLLSPFVYKHCYSHSFSHQTDSYPPL